MFHAQHDSSARKTPTLRILANSLVQFLPEVVFFAKRRDGRKFFTNSPIFFSHPHQEGSRRLVFLPLFYHGFQFFFAAKLGGKNTQKKVNCLHLKGVVKIMLLRRFQETLLGLKSAKNALVGKCSPEKKTPQFTIRIQGCLGWLFFFEI